MGKLKNTKNRAIGLLHSYEIKLGCVCTSTSQELFAKFDNTLDLLNYWEMIKIKINGCKI